MQKLKVNEHSSGSYTCYLVDQDGLAVGAVNVTLARLTLYDYTSDQILNSRNDQDVRNLNGVTIADVVEGGVTRTKITWSMQPADNAVVDQTRTGVEKHIALFSFSWLGGHLHHEAVIYVQPLARIPRASE